MRLLIVALCRDIGMNSFSWLQTSARFIFLIYVSRGSSLLFYIRASVVSLTTKKLRTDHFFINIVPCNT